MDDPSFVSDITFVNEIHNHQLSQQKPADDFSLSHNYISQNQQTTFYYRLIT